MNSFDVGMTAPKLKINVRNLIWNELGLLSLLIMEVSLIVPWYRAHVVVGASIDVAITYLTVFGFALLVMYTSRYMQANQALFSFHMLGLFVLLLLGLYAFLQGILYEGLSISFGQFISKLLRSFATGSGGNPLSILVILSVLFMWWRGTAIAGMGDLEFFVTRRKFRLGILMLGAYGIFHRFAEGVYLLDILPIFFLSGLLAITLARTHRISQRKAAFRLPFTGGWFSGTTSIMLIIILIGAMVGAFLRTEIASQIAELIGTILLRGFQTLVVVISPLVLWVLPLAEKLAQYLAENMSLQPAPEDSNGGLIDDEVFAQEAVGAETQFPSELIIAIVLLLLLLLIFLVARRVRRRWKSERPNFGDEGESTGDRQSLQRGLHRIWDQAQDGLDLIRKFGFGRRMLAANAIRRTYSQFLDLAEDMGKPRRSYETPFEFQRQISMMFPEETNEIALLTTAYTQVRYGEFPEDVQIVSKVREAWQVIRRAAK